MSKIVLDTIASGYNLSKINTNFQTIEGELNGKVLYRDNPVGEPNSMSQDLDMNSKNILNNNILNSNVLLTQSLFVAGKSVVSGEALEVPSAANVPFTPVGNLSSVDVQSALGELDTEKEPADSTILKDADIGVTVQPYNDTLGVFRGAFVYSNSYPLPTTNPLPVPFVTEYYDTSSIHDPVTNNTRLTVPAGVSYVRLSASGSYSPLLGGGRFAYVLKNAGSFPGAFYWEESNPTATSFPSFNFTTHVYNVAPGDYFELMIRQTSGSTINVSGITFSMEIVG